MAKQGDAPVREAGPQKGVWVRIPPTGLAVNFIFTALYKSMATILKDGLNHYCLDCERERGRQNYKKPAYREATKYRNLKNLYGITKEEYLDKLELQNHVCAICKSEFLNSRDIHLDHCHKTRLIRDILCQQCNFLVGILESNPTKVDLCWNYLKRHFCGD